MDRIVEKRAEVVALIPARGGSKGLPRKNVRLLAGHPLIAYAITAALDARTVTRVIVSTDDPEIAQVARAYGAVVPFSRPSELAQDDTPDLPVFVHALRWMEAEWGYRPEIIVNLRPTSPLCQPEDLDRAVALLMSCPEADAVRMVGAPFQNPFKMWHIGTDGFLVPLLGSSIPEAYNQRRQVLPQVFWQNGVDVTRRRTLLELNSMTGRRILPLVCQRGGWESWVDIDTEATLDLADFLLRSGKVTRKSPRLR